MARKTYEIAFEIAGKLASSFGNMFTSANNHLAQVKRQISSLQRETKDLERSLKDGKITAEEYARAYAKVENQLKQAEQAQKRFTQAAKAEQLAQKTDQFRGKMQSGLLGATGAAVAMSVPVSAAISFESSMADVRKVVDFETPKQFKAMEQDILNLSKRIPMAAEGLAQIVAAGGQAGLARDELVAYAEAAAKMGVAFDITADEAGQIMAQWRSAFKMNQEQVNTLADQINLLGNTTAASAPKISEVVRRIGPLGEVGGAAAAQIAALGATMVGAGVEEEVAATGIKNLILSMVAGESATKSQAEAFQALGMDAKQMAVMMQKDAQGAIMSVFQALQKLPKEKQAAVLSELFGKESIGAIAPLLTNLDALQENFKKVGDATQYAGSMNKEFEARSATTANKLQLLQNNAKALSIAVGNILLPTVNSIAEKLSVAAQKVEVFTQKHPALTRALVIGAAAVTGLVFAVTGLGLAFSLVISPITRFYAWATKVELMSKLATAGTRAWAAAQRVLNLVMRANPIGLVITAIGLLIAAGVYLYKNWDTVRAKASQLWETISNAFRSGVNKAIDWINRLIEKVNLIPGINIKTIGKLPANGSSSVNALGLKKHARGGFSDRPAIFGEAGPEVAIPLDGSRRSLALWERTGQLLGASGGDVIMYVNFAPVINGAGQDILPALRREEQNFIEQLKAAWHQERRLKYA
jgi:TP901 family phage tail tape measure protein